MTAAEQRQHQNRRRRAAFRHALFTRAPVRLTRGLLARVRPGKNFKLTHRTIHLPNLPDELCGLRITHISDPHIGELITPAHLPHIVQAANDLRSDLIAVTGDFIDFSNAFLPDIVAALAELRAPLGAWFVLGNHDYLDNPDALKRAFQVANLNLLLNQSIRLGHRGRVIALAGVDWCEQPADLTRHVRSVSHTMKSADLSILLAHHPHAFDTACQSRIDLTLSGHTHGGQILFSNHRSKKGSIGLANLAFRYTRGLYSRGPHRLYVTSGVGSWFPLRFRCPAEIACLELQSDY